VTATDTSQGNVLRTERRGHVAVLTLDRPDRLNALNDALRAAIHAAIAEVRADDEVRAVVITGAGRGFCAGADLMARVAGEADSAPPSQDEKLDEWGWVGRLALAVHDLDKPTIAAVNGVAAGAGMSLSLGCDLRVGGPATRFKTVFVERALSPDTGMSYLLPRIVGSARAFDLVYTSRDVGADEAHRLGLLDRLVGEGEDVVDAAVALAETMVRWPPLALRSAKRVLQHNIDATFEEALRYESSGLDYAMRATNDRRESIAAFREKREGRYTGT
jgi:2-(1,2-epoxy-1,2-dihydrophenyl)acetyl-CoA isomerase